MVELAVNACTDVFAAQRNVFAKLADVLVPNRLVPIVEMGRPFGEVVLDTPGVGVVEPLTKDLAHT